MRTTPSSAPLAYHLTLRTFGTWLPGDPRGWHKRSDDARRAPSPALAEWCRRQMRFSPMIFAPAQRVIVADAIHEVCARRAWWLHTLRVQSNHAHAVITAPQAPELLVAALKRAATQSLRDREPALRQREIWARHASTRYLRNPTSVAAAICYVRDDHHG